MNILRIAGILSVAMGLAGCGGSDLASRSKPMNSPELALAGRSAQKRILLSPQYDVTEINIIVPETLKVSEANLYYPIADIVWRGEQRGDRYTQVKNIFTEAFGLGTGNMKYGPKVIVDAEVTRFHSLTEKTRYTIGGVHSIRFNLTVRDAETGGIIDGPRKVLADVKAAGGRRAIAEEQAGRTQRVVIIEQLRAVILRELSRKTEESPVGRAASDQIAAPAHITTETVPLR